MGLAPRNKETILVWGDTQAVTGLSAGPLESDSSLTAERLPLLLDELN